MNAGEGGGAVSPEPIGTGLPQIAKIPFVSSATGLRVTLASFGFYSDSDLSWQSLWLAGSSYKAHDDHKNADSATCEIGTSENTIHARIFLSHSWTSLLLIR